VTVLLKNGKVIDYKTRTEDYFDIFIENGIIKEIAKEINVLADNVIDCTNLFIIPGMIDIHCHLREPGFEPRCQRGIYFYLSNAKYEPCMW